MFYFARILLVFSLILGSVHAADNDAQTDIINGQTANYSFTPFMVSLQVNRGGGYVHSCGGSIIEDNFVLTAAHCVEGQSANSLAVYHGSGSLIAGGFRYQIAEIFMHRDYSRFIPYENDIALLYVPNLYGVEPVQLASEGFYNGLFLNTEVELIGWGHYDRFNNNPSNLLFGILNFLPPLECQNYYFNATFSWGGTTVDYRWITERNVCAGVNSFYGQQPCHGDSGGPLMVFNGSRYVQIGITSFGEPNNPAQGLLGCGVNGEPAVFTRVGNFIPWISQTITDFYNRPISQPSTPTGPSTPSTGGQDTSAGSIERPLLAVLLLIVLLRRRLIRQR